MKRIVILDGYSDEPAGLGVPPYVDVYPRYVAGAVLSADPGVEIRYFTVDQARSNIDFFMEIAGSADLVVFLASVVVPGKYIGGEPIRPEEIILWSRLLEKPVKVLGGVAARYGMGYEGGAIAVPPERLAVNFDIVVKGDVEAVVYRLVKERLHVEKVDPGETRDYKLLDSWAVKGATIVAQHPNYGLNLIAEIETFRGCPRYIVGGCSFCVEPLRGEVEFRPVESIMSEVAALRQVGVRCFRLGRQPDFYAYMARYTGWIEFPRPNPEAIKKLMAGVKSAAPDADVIHIDNVNPGTVYHYPEESVRITKTIIEYHTPGDVAAFGVESADPRVIKLNNLKVMPDEAFQAIKILNNVGGRRGWNGLPELLPGVNLLHGLIGETRETYRLNYEFLKKVFEAGLMLRRINIRQVIPIPGTRMWTYGLKTMKQHKGVFRLYRDKIRKEIDVPMLKRVVPKGVILRRVFAEKRIGGRVIGRQVGTYPLQVRFLLEVELLKFYDVLIVGHSARSVEGIPLPIDINRVSAKVLQTIPGVDKGIVMKIIMSRPIKNSEQLEALIGPRLARFFKVSLPRS